MDWIDLYTKQLLVALHPKASRLALPSLPGVSVALTGIALTRRATSHCVWIITTSPDVQERVYSDLCSLSRTAEITPVPFPQQFEEDAESAGARARVIRMMRGLSETKNDTEDPPTIVVATILALRQPAPDPDALKEASVTLRAGGSYAFDELTAKLVSAGYNRVTEVTEPGQIAIRGGVLDAWPPAAKTPWRAEFFDTELESLRMFDPATQRSIEEGESVWLPPCSEASLGALIRVSSVIPAGSSFLWVEHDALMDNALAEPDWETLQKEVEATKPGLQLFTGDPPPAQTPTAAFPITAVPGLAELGAEEARHPELLAKARHNLLQSFVKEAQKGATVFLCADTAGTCELLSREVEYEPKVTIKKLAISGGFALPDLIAAAQPDLYAVCKKNLRRVSSPRAEQIQGPRIEQASDLESGDYVVHVDYGIGRFLGSTEIEVNGKRVEVFTIEYADKAKLHVPVSHAHLLSKYVGVSGHSVKLHRLGGRKWTREKADAERAVQDLAASLLETQAKRQMVEGISFNTEPEWMPEFEADFPYQETVDQERCIADIKRDMAKSRPMDRLVCGDAGYGKTEVAMRAAFLAVMNGYQVAVLVPTTVLAEQHYETFCDRMSPYPVHIAPLNRFHAKSVCERSIQGAVNGDVDILIGTHAILSDNISFKNLGLLIIDEEQRFGVAHKEKLKSIRQIVDVLTLSATPIPRTLYMSMTGARDMSLLQTPPRERVAVETRVARDTDAVLAKAISQEVRRGGQVYFLYNRVLTIHIMRRRLEALLPDVRFAVAHGQMPSGELSQVMSSFEAGEIDVLICTTIVESGLDIPRANTMIVHRADRFGISDLYQLRGRVGRLAVKGYTWLILPEHGQVDAEARERIAALRRHSGLGAGFSLALRDLENRGSGNLLGSAQSGHIAAVGFGLYCQLLRRTIARVKGEKPPMIVDVVMELDFLDLSPGSIDPERSACLPYGYMDDEGQRMSFHRKLAEANSQKEVRALRRELSDRYGKPPTAVDRMLKVTMLRIQAAELKIGRIETRDLKIYIYPRRDRSPILINKHIPLLFGRTADECLVCIAKTLKKLEADNKLSPKK